MSDQEAVIFKATIHLKQLGRVFCLQLPEGAVPLSFHAQNNAPRLWYTVPNPGRFVAAWEGDLNPLLETRKFVLVGTGVRFSPEGCKFIGTALVNGGRLVLHLFEVIA